MVLRAPCAKEEKNSIVLNWLIIEPGGIRLVGIHDLVWATVLVGALLSSHLWFLSMSVFFFLLVVALMAAWF